MTSEHETQTELSEIGRTRREQMLHVLLGEMTAVHRRRRVRRNVAIGAIPLLVVVASLGIWLMNTEGPSATSPRQSPVVQDDSKQGTQDKDRLASSVQPSMSVEYVKTDAQIVERYRVTDQAKVIYLDDSGLLSALAQMNRPAGLIRSEGRTWLTAEVTDHQGG